MSVPVLLILGDAGLRAAVARCLRAEGLAISEAASAGEGLALARRQRPALILLDAPPGTNGSGRLYRQLRQAGEPLLLLLGPGTTDVEIVAALEAGADHYVRMPCSGNELLAHVRALLRRRGGRVGPRPNELQIGDLRIVIARQEVALAGRPIHLSPKEFEILALLAEHAGRVVSRAELLRAVWPGRRSVKSSTLDVHIFGLRTKLEDDPANPKRILTVRAVGYRLVAGEEE